MIDVLRESAGSCKHLGRFSWRSVLEWQIRLSLLRRLWSRSLWQAKGKKVATSKLQHAKLASKAHLQTGIANSNRGLCLQFCSYALSIESGASPAAVHTKRGLSTANRSPKEGKITKAMKIK